MTVHTIHYIDGEAYFMCTAYETIVNMRLNLQQRLAYRASGLWLLTIAFQGDKLLYAQSPDPSAFFRVKGVACKMNLAV